MAALTACALVAVVGVTLLLGLGYAGPGAGVATDALSSRRVALWSDAVALTGDQPLRGSGLGTFPERSETARSDADTRFTHSLTLEIAAESGILAAAACLAGLVLLTLAPTDRLPGPRAALASCAVAVFTVQASIDYTYRFPAVVLAASAVAGLCAGPEVQASAVRPTRGIRA